MKTNFLRTVLLLSLVFIFSAYVYRAEVDESITLHKSVERLELEVPHESNVFDFAELDDGEYLIHLDLRSGYESIEFFEDGNTIIELSPSEFILHANSGLQEFVINYSQAVESRFISVSVMNKTRLKGDSEITRMQDSIADSLIVTTNIDISKAVIEDFIGSSCFNARNVEFRGIDSLAIGSFSGADSLFGFHEGIVFGSSDVREFPLPNTETGTGGAIGGGGDPDLEILSGQTINDAQVIEFDFTPTIDTVRFNYVFASEEYCDFIESYFNDAFGFFISGPGINGPFSNNAINIATLPNGDPVSISSVNWNVNPDFYISNVEEGSQFGDCPPDELAAPPAALDEIMFDGWTVTLTAVAAVIPCETYHIKLAIGDAFDSAFGSAVFLESGSFSAGDGIEFEVNYPNGDAALEGCQEEVCVTFSVIGDPDSINIDIPIDVDSASVAIEGVDFDDLPDVITIPAGESSVELCITIFEDDIAEGTEELLLNLENICSCEDSSIVILIQDVDSLVAIIGGNATGCSGEQVAMFTDVSGGLPDYNYEWNTGDTASNIVIILDDIFDFSVTITDQCGSEIVLEWSIVSDCCEEPIIAYDLNECLASPGETAIYEEFTPQFPCELECTEIDATILFRSPGESFRHSCTAGVDDKAMCVGALDACEYNAGSPSSIIFEFTVDPEDGKEVLISGFSFYEKAPEMFEWIGGDEGMNDYPTLYGLRVLKNDVVIFEMIDIPTSTDWTLEEFSFDSTAVADELCTFRFELLSYCLIANGANVQAWDVDELQLFGKCQDQENLLATVSGFLTTSKDLAYSDADMILNSENSDIWLSQSGQNGEYSFVDIPFGQSYTVVPISKVDYKNGISTYDLIIIQKHLLGIKEFDSVYDFIAADANGNNAVSAADIAELRKLLLGATNTLAVDSWRFVENSAELSLANPYSFEGVEAVSADRDINQADFVSVKIGDLNESAELITGNETENRTIWVLTYELEYNESENKTTARFYTEEKSNMSGLQMSLEGSLKDFSSGELYFEADMIHSKNQQINLSWMNAEGVTISANDVLFSLDLDGQQSLLELNSLGLAPEVYNSDHVSQVLLQKRSVEATPSFSLQPNPSSDYFEITYKGASREKMNVTVQDFSGKLILTKEFELETRNIKISRDELGSNGVYLIQVQAGETFETFKAILID